MISNPIEFAKAQQEIQLLQNRLQQLQKDHPVGTKGFTKAGIHKLIARIHEELAIYEGSQESAGRSINS